MIHTLAIANYRSLREVILPLDQLTIIIGANGSGKSNLYRALRLLSDTAMGGAIPSLAREGGINSAVWAGPETFAKDVKKNHLPVQGGPRKKPVNLKLGFASDNFSYSIEFGLPVPQKPSSAFDHDPASAKQFGTETDGVPFQHWQIDMAVWYTYVIAGASGKQHQKISLDTIVCSRK